jgi:hypothetical protein
MSCVDFVEVMGKVQHMTGWIGRQFLDTGIVIDVINFENGHILLVGKMGNKMCIDVVGLIDL